MGTRAGQGPYLDLASAFTRKSKKVTYLLEREPEAVGGVERAGGLELVWLEVGEVELDRARLWVDIEIEMMPTGDEGARTRNSCAITAGLRAEIAEECLVLGGEGRKLVEVGRGVEGEGRVNGNRFGADPLRRYHLGHGKMLAI